MVSSNEEYSEEAKRDMMRAALKGSTDYPSLGRLAYETYGQQMGVAMDTPWAEVLPGFRLAWHNVAEAVVDQLLVEIQHNMDSGLLDDMSAKHAIALSAAMACKIGKIFDG